MLKRLISWIREFFPHKMAVDYGISHLLSPGCKVVVYDPFTSTTTKYKVVRTVMDVNTGKHSEIWARRTLW